MAPFRCCCAFYNPGRLEINEMLGTGRSRRYCTTSNQIQPVSQSQVHCDAHREKTNKTTFPHQKMRAKNLVGCVKGGPLMTSPQTSNRLAIEKRREEKKKNQTHIDLEKM
jgi:hypothetical protein